MGPHALHVIEMLAAASAVGGPWGVLRLVLRGRIAVQLERERRTTVTAALKELPPGGHIVQWDADGFRIVRPSSDPRDGDR